MNPNPLQDSFNLLHSLILKEILEDHDKEDAIRKNLFSLIIAYNSICKALDYPLNHKTREDILIPTDTV